MQALDSHRLERGTRSLTPGHRGRALDGTRAVRRVAVLLAVAVAAFLLLFQQGEITVSDGATMYRTDKSIVQHASLTIPAHYGNGIKGVGGHYYSKYGLGLSLLALPPYLLGDAIASVVGHTDRVEQAAV